MKISLTLVALPYSAVHQKTYGEFERYVKCGSKGFSYPETNTIDIENSYDSESGEPPLTNDSLSPFSISSGEYWPSLWLPITTEECLLIKFRSFFPFLNGLGNSSDYPT